MNRATKVIIAVSLTVILVSVGFIGGFAVAQFGAMSDQAVLADVGGNNVVGSKVNEVNALLQEKALKPPSETSATAGAKRTQKPFGSWGRAGPRPQADERSEKLIRHPLDVVPPLEDRDVLVQLPLAHAPERPQEVAQPRPQPRQRVVVDLADAVAVVVPRLVCAPKTGPADMRVLIRIG